MRNGLSVWSGFRCSAALFRRREKAGAADIGTQHGHLSKLHVKNTEDLERYVLIAVVNRPDGVVAVVGECLWERRDFWDQEMMALLKTFKG